MLKIYFRAGLRNLLRYRSFSLINLIGLSLGFSAVMVLATMLYQYLTTNGQFRNAGRIYYIKTRPAGGNEYMQTPYPFLAAVLKACPDVEAGTHLQSWNWPWLKAGEKEFQDNTWFVEPDFFRVFSFPLVFGNPQTSLQDKHSVVLSQEMAVKLFGSAFAAAGKTLLMDDSVGLTVTGVMEPVPTNTTIRPQVLLPAELLHDNKDFAGGANWYNTFAENYLLLRPGTDTARLNTQLNQLAQANFDPQIRKATVRVAPYSHYIGDQAGNLVQVLIKGQIGTIFFILLIVIANLVNLNAATLFTRQKEIAVRKMMGSRRRHILLQFILENALTVFAALGLAFLLFTNLLLPAINMIIGDRFGAIALNFRHDYPLAGVFLLGGLLIVIVAGSAPGWHFASLRPVDAIKGRVAGGRGRGSVTRNVFITLQFVLATTFIGISIILHSQIRHMKTAALGFEKDCILVVPSDLAFKDPKTAASRFDALLNDLRSNPAVRGVSTSENIPTAYDHNFNTFFDPVTNREVHMQQGSADAGLLPTFGIGLAGGRNFINMNDSLDANAVMINRKAVMQLGWTMANAAGKILRAKGDNQPHTVVGVMDDFHYEDLTHDIGPLVHFFTGHQRLGGRYLSVRAAPGHEADVARLLTAGFKEMPSRRPFQYEWLGERIDKQYSLLEGILKATNYVAILMVFIAAMGLFGLIALFTRQRVKEVGIRKVLGAGTGDIVGLLSRNFLVLIGLALLIATPMAWMVMHNWLQDFAYRIDIQWWMLAGAGLIAVGIGVLTVGYHTVRAAMANPVDALRSE
jgi:putative ABC transport system permease protein